MIFVPQFIEFRIKCLIDSKYIFLFWNKKLNACDKLFLSSLSDSSTRINTNDFILPIKKPLLMVLESANSYLGINCFADICIYLNSKKCF